ncbi:MAG: glucose 1-dehydrogenase [Sterolibacterium sp.]|nr:glucose 1-dehydrogenase [Sterolibacterium sp.]
MGKLEGKVAIVTGAARGQGAAEARRLVEEGAAVVLADMLDDEGKKMASVLGERALFVHLDVRQEADWTAVVDATIKKFGRLDILVNNAGVIRFAPVALMPPELFRFVVDINFYGPYLGMRAVIPKMMEAGSGSIINISSINGLMGTPTFAAYAGSKHGLIGMTKSVAMELGATGIRVNAICPGEVDTPMLSEASATVGMDIGAAMAGRIPLGRMARPEEIASMVVFLACDDSSYCTGGVFVVDGGLSAGFSLA